MRPFHLARFKKQSVFAEIQQLRKFYGDDLLTSMLGIKIWAFRFKRQPAPVARLAYLLHRLTFDPARPLTVLEILVLGKFGTGTPAKITPPDSQTSVENLDYEI